MKKCLSGIKNQICSIYKNKPLIFFIIWALILNFIIEIGGRHSVLKALAHLFTRPQIFVLNASVIFLPMVFGFLFKRRDFYMALVSILWLTLGMVNFILLFFRTTPLSTIDFAIVPAALSMIDAYLSTFEIVLVGVWVIAIIAGIFLCWKKLPKTDRNWKKSIISVAVTVAVITATISVSVVIASKTNSFAMIKKAYNKWGFVYCFSRGFIDSGINKPDEYSENILDKSLKAVAIPEKEEKDKPNVIFVQLESFFDVSYLKNFTFTKDSIPTFTKLKETCPSGLLTVPSMGGGTANTEFEIITGINLDFFGIGEYPYQTIIKKQPCASVARTFKDKGYYTTAIHNHTAEFYNRNEVYPNLGFDKFIPVEYMDIDERNDLGWAMDSIFLENIPEVMELTPERDFVFAVTVQTHGKYPSRPVYYDKNIYANLIEYNEEDEDMLYSLNYYANEVKETDDVIAGLIEYFEDYHEPVAIVFYGDHLPAFEITDEDLDGINIYQTEYCIWTNYKDLEPQKEDISSYQLASLAFDKLELNGDVFLNTTSKMKNSPEYEETLELFAYDMLYGDNHVQGKTLETSNCELGMHPIQITEVEPREQTALIKGHGFTEFSYVMVNNKKVKTTHIDENNLKIDIDALEEGDCNVSVAQISSQHTMLSKTENFYIEPFLNN